MSVLPEDIDRISLAVQKKNYVFLFVLIVSLIFSVGSFYLQWKQERLLKLEMLRQIDIDFDNKIMFDTIDAKGTKQLQAKLEVGRTYLIDQDSTDPYIRSRMVRWCKVERAVLGTAAKKLGTNCEKLLKEKWFKEKYNNGMTQIEPITE
ncbi:hypothetical protein OA92_07505 [Marinomonas sp. SBI22]|uniref:hypothetical protein n=1 Tax=unclassified Marinomonas TaxID=196814 RepID=UPI0007AFB833|nr:MULTISPECIES: hypothetical protein [unclassified Marinomonas]KZM40454.1 hypothetical protein OA91_19705 [Marinomonas sp. SBI8L]KZM43545.1 hypothetical protein OA92_07505 [Marinomonas sp. SBI22]